MFLNNALRGLPFFLNFNFGSQHALSHKNTFIKRISMKHFQELTLNFSRRPKLKFKISIPINLITSKSKNKTISFKIYSSSTLRAEFHF